jgi:phage gp36-like protein
VSYCTTSDLIDRFSESELIALTDRDNTGYVDAQIAGAAISDASALIDGYLGGRYALPLSVVPTVLAKICADIARFNLYDNAVPDVVEKHYNAALAFLKSVGKGEVRLGLSDTEETATSDDAIEMQSGGSVWNREDSKGFI